MISNEAPTNTELPPMTIRGRGIGAVSIVLDNPSVASGGSCNVTLELRTPSGQPMPAQGPVSVTLSSSNPTVASVPAQATVPSGEWYVSCPIQTQQTTANTDVSITAHVPDVYQAPPPALLRVLASAATASLAGKITLEGAVSMAYPITFTFRPADGSAAYTHTVQPSADGSFTLTGLPKQVCALWIKGPRWLSQIVMTDTRAGDMSGLAVTLKAGDANNDDSVDALDLGMIIDAFNSSQGDAVFNPAADLNGDGSVDAVDLSLLIDNFNRAGATAS